MKIAVIGWGSLIWNPGDLAIVGKPKSWHSDGPLLPIEFSRKSNSLIDPSVKGRLTLVIAPDLPQDQYSQSFWALSEHQSLDAALSDLKAREGTTRIGHVTRDPDQSNFSRIGSIVSEWLDGTRLDAVIWTNLPATIGLSRERSIEFLASLRKTKFEKDAREYIEMAPPNIQTACRKEISERLNWRVRDPYPTEYFID